MFFGTNRAIGEWIGEYEELRGASARVCDPEYMSLYVGATRMHYCDNCERETSQRLEHLQKNGVGTVIAQRWMCTQCDRYVGDLPPKPSSDLEALWDAS